MSNRLTISDGSVSFSIRSSEIMGYYVQYGSELNPGAGHVLLIFIRGIPEALSHRFEYRVHLTSAITALEAAMDNG